MATFHASFIVLLLAPAIYLAPAKTLSQATVASDAEFRVATDAELSLLQLSRTQAEMYGIVFKKKQKTGLEPCPGDSRGDGRCDKDETHRVCAKIGIEGTSFWKNTGQDNWCGQDLYDDGKTACPADKPTWCICKWATADWIRGEGCDDSIEFDCAATDVCDLKTSYTDADTDLKIAHDCMAKKCPTEWNACP